jgi:hypothetical protein
VRCSSLHAPVVDVAAGGGRGGSLAHDVAQLGAAVRWGATASGPAAAGVAVVDRGAGDNLAGLARKLTLTAIAAELGRPVSTVSREVRRNSGPNGYRAARADRLATLRTARPRAGKLADDPALRSYVEAKLALAWSPRQISRRPQPSTFARRGRVSGLRCLRPPALRRDDGWWAHNVAHPEPTGPGEARRIGLSGPGAESALGRRRMRRPRRRRISSSTSSGHRPSDRRSWWRCSEP